MDSHFLETSIQGLSSHCSRKKKKNDYNNNYGIYEWFVYQKENYCEDLSVLCWNDKEAKNKFFF